MTIIEKIKALFSAEVEAKFLDAKLVDGTIVRTDAEEFKVGDKLSVITESGEIVQAPEGMHELENGDVLVVDAEGKITEVRKPEVAVEAEEEVKPEEPAKEAEVAMAEIEIEVPAEESVVEEAPVAPSHEDRMLALEAKCAELEAALMLIAEQLKAKEAEVVMSKEKMSALKDENEKLKKAPAAEPVKVTKFEATAELTEKNNKIARIANIIAKK